MPTPQETVERVYDRLLARDMDGLADLLAEDVVIEYPFAPPEFPWRIDGRDSYREQISAAMRRSRMVQQAFESKVMYQTTDPEVIVVELALRARLRDGGETLREVIQVIRVRDGRIVFWRDYFDPLSLTRLLDRAGA